MTARPQLVALWRTSSKFSTNRLPSIAGDSIVRSEAYLQKFDHNAQCLDDPDGSIYPPMDEITERFFTSHRLAIEVLQQADDSLFTGANPNEAMRAKFATIGSLHGSYLGGHVMMHIGQRSAWRRIMGLRPG